MAPAAAAAPPHEFHGWLGPRCVRYFYFFYFLSASCVWLLFFSVPFWLVDFQYIFPCIYAFDACIISSLCCASPALKFFPFLVAARFYCNLMCSGRAQLPIIVVESLLLNHFEAMMSILQAPAIAVRSEDKFEASCYVLIWSNAFHVEMCIMRWIFYYFVCIMCLIVICLCSICFVDFQIYIYIYIYFHVFYAFDVCIISSIFCSIPAPASSHYAALQPGGGVGDELVPSK